MECTNKNYELVSTKLRAKKATIVSYKKYTYYSHEFLQPSHNTSGGNNIIILNQFRLFINLMSRVYLSSTEEQTHKK